MNTNIPIEITILIAMNLIAFLILTILDIRSIFNKRKNAMKEESNNEIETDKIDDITDDKTDDDNFNFEVSGDIEEETLQKEVDIKLDEYLDALMRLQSYKFHSVLATKAYSLKIEKELKL